MNGNVTPVTGKKELATDIFKNAWNPKIIVIPIAINFPYISGHRLAILNPLRTSATNNADTNRHPKNPNSSAIIAKIKSV